MTQAQDHFQCHSGSGFRIYCHRDAILSFTILTIHIILSFNEQWRVSMYNIKLWWSFNNIIILFQSPTSATWWITSRTSTVWLRMMDLSSTILWLIRTPAESTLALLTNSTSYHPTWNPRLVLNSMQCCLMYVSVLTRTKTLYSTGRMVLDSTIVAQSSVTQEIRGPLLSFCTFSQT